MGFFNDISKKTTETTSKIAREGKLRIQINENRGKMKDLYQNIGEIIYTMYINQEKINIKEDLAEQLKELDELSNEIENARLEILKLNKKMVCKNCSAEIPNDVNFCPQCGTKQPKDEPVVEETAEKTEIEKKEAVSRKKPIKKTKKTESK